MSTISIVVLRTSRNELRSTIFERLNTINETKRNKILEYFDEIEQKAEFIRSNPKYKEHISKSLKIYSNNDSIRALGNVHKKYLEKEINPLETAFGFHRIMFKTLDGLDLIDSKSYKNLAEEDKNCLLYTSPSPRDA